MFQAVLFDLDGVLIDSRDAWFEVLNAATRAFGHPEVPRELYDPSFGQGVDADVEMFLPGCSVAEVDAWFEAHFLDHAGHVKVNPDAIPVLMAFASRGIRTAVVTNTQSALARETCRGAGIETDLIVGASDVARGKPAPDMVVLACERLGVAPASAVMVGDSRFDAEAAEAAGVRFIGLGIDGDPRIERLPELLHLS